MLLKKILIFLQKNWLIIAILFLAGTLRVYRLPQLTTFAGDQGIDLLLVKRMIVDHRWTLLGPKTSILPIYNGPIYYYMILPVLYFSRLNPMSVSYFMINLWLGAIYLTYFLGKKLFGERAGILAALFFSIWPIGVEYSRQSFNSFPTPFFAVIYLIGLWFFVKEGKTLGILLAGLSFGVMMQLHYFNFFLFVFVFYLLIERKLQLRKFALFVVGFLITFSPMLLFETRHDFFNTRMLFISLRQKGLSDFHFQIHYLIAFFPVFFLFLGHLLDWLLKAIKSLGVIILIGLTIINLRGIDLSRSNGFTMPSGWNYLGVKKASEIIAKDAPANFNVASLVDGDTRAYPFRYIIEIHGRMPMGVEAYPEAKVLYVIAKGNKTFVLDYPVWEIQSFLPSEVEKEWPVQNDYKVFKLLKRAKK